MRAEFSIVLGKREQRDEHPARRAAGRSSQPLRLRQGLRPAERLRQASRASRRDERPLRGDHQRPASRRRGRHPRRLLARLRRRGSVSLKEALDAAHGHEHDEDGIRADPGEESAKPPARRRTTTSTTMRRKRARLWKYRQRRAASRSCCSLVLRSPRSRSSNSNLEAPEPCSTNSSIGRSPTGRSSSALALLLMVMGLRTATELPVEVLPDLTKPTVIILTEAPGPRAGGGRNPRHPADRKRADGRRRTHPAALEFRRRRSRSSIAEFGWGTDIYKARQFVQERLQGVREQLPEGVQPFMTPVASLMGEILLVGVRHSKEGEPGYMPPMRRAHPGRLDDQAAPAKHPRHRRNPQHGRRREAGRRSSPTPTDAGERRQLRGTGKSRRAMPPATPPAASSTPARRKSWCAISP